MSDHVYLTTPEAAAFLRMQPRTLEKWRVAGFGPAHTKFGKRVLYAKAELERFCEANRRQSTSQRH